MAKKKAAKKRTTKKKGATKKGVVKKGSHKRQRTEVPITVKVGSVKVFDGIVDNLNKVIDGKDEVNLKHLMVLAMLKKYPSGLSVVDLAKRTGLVSSTVGLVLKTTTYKGLKDKGYVTSIDVEPQVDNPGGEVFKISASGKKKLAEYVK